MTNTALSVQHKDLIMTRSLWTGSISFGLVAVPIRLVTAVRDKSIHFNLLSPDGSCRLRRKLYCPETGVEYDFKETARGYEIAPDQYVLLQEDELKELKPEAGRSINISDFVDLASADPLYFDRTYYLLPGEGGAKAYRLLVEAMAKSRKAAVAQFVMHDNQHLALVRALDDALVLHTMHYADEIVPAGSLKDELATDVAVSERELKVAQQLIASLDTNFKPEAYRDTYRDEVKRLIELKAEGEAVTVSTQTEEELDIGQPINLMEALKKSLAQQKADSTRRPAAGRKRTAPAQARPRRRRSA